MPKGIYYNIHQKWPNNGDIVAICLSQELRQLALKDGYVRHGGHCHGTTPLIKQIVAMPGDKVWITDDTITVNHKVYLVKKLIFIWP